MSLVGHFYLTELLLPLIIQSQGRIVNVGSGMNFFADGQFNKSKTEKYNPILAYARSKLANTMHTIELQRRYGEQGIKAYSLHPGSILSTELNRDRGIIQAMMLSLFAISGKTIPQGAMTTLYCALSDEAQPGKYHSNCRVAQANHIAFDSTKTRELWNLSEEIIKEKCGHF